MMMTEKYCTLPPTSSSTSLYYSTIYHSPITKNHIREIKNRLHSQKKQISTLYEHNNMKLLIEQQPTIRTYSLYDIQERINYFEKKKTITDDIENISKDKILSNPSLSSTSAETLQSVIANTLQQTFFNHESYGSALSRTMMNSRINDNFLGKRRSLSTSYLICSNDQKCSNPYYSSLSKRVRTYSLSNHSTMAMTATATFSEEQNTDLQETNSNDYENTYFYPEETTRLDDALSLTTITSNVQAKITNTQHDASVYSSDTTVFQSDTDDNSEAVKPIVQQYYNTNDINTPTNLQNENIKDNDEQLIRIRLNLTPPDRDFTGVFHAKKCTVVKEQECLSDYDDVNHCSKQNNKIRSNIDNVSLNKSMTSSLQHEHRRKISTDEQLNQQSKQTNENEKNDDVYSQVNQEEIVHSITMNNHIEMIPRQENDDDDDDEHYSDESHYSDDLRYSSDAARNSCASDDLNNTSSTLRQEAISITRVRCKRRKTWIRSPSSPSRSSTNNNNNNSTKSTSYLQQHRLNANLIQPFLSNNQVDGTDARQNANVNSTITTKTATSTVLNQTRVKATATTMLLHNNSLDCNNNNNSKNGETPSYDFISLNDDYHSIKTDESQLSKTTSTLLKDTSSSSSSLCKVNDFYPSSLSPVKRLLNESIDSNIEIIQMDEQECVLEIVDGVLTIVPKDKSITSSISSNIEKNSEQQNSNYNSSKHQKQRSSSIASSVSTPSLSEHEQEHDDSSSSSSPSSRLSSKPFIVTQDVPVKKPYSPIQTEQSNDVLDLFSSPIIPNNKTQKKVLDDSLSSVSSGSDRRSQIKKQKSNIPRSSSPINNKSTLPSIKVTSPSSVENQTRSNKTTVLTQLLQSVKKTSANNETDFVKPKTDYPKVETVKKTSTNNDTNIDKSKTDYPIIKTEPIPVPKPINKDRIHEFASLLSSSVHLSQPPQSFKKSTTSTSKVISSPTRSEDQSFSSVPSLSSDRDERESYHTVKSNNSEQEQIKKHIDARYNDKLDDRGSIKIKTANIKALFEQKITDTNKILSQSSEHLSHLPEPKQQHKKIPISYGSLKRNLPNHQQTIPNNNNNNRPKAYHESSTMNKYTDHIVGTKDVVIEDKQPENGYGNNSRRNSIEQIVRPTINSSSNSPVSVTNAYYSESLLAREIREAKEKEDELKRQRRKCGLAEDGSNSMLNSTNDSIKSESTLTTNQPIKSSSFLSNLDFFTSKTNGSPLNESTSSNSSPRRSIALAQNIVYDSNNPSPSKIYRQSSNDDLKQMTNVVSQELNRFNENGISIIRTSSTSGSLYRSSSNQNILSIHNTNDNIIQREIEAIRAKETELRQLGRIQHTSDEHADPRKYQELITTLPKSQSINTLPTGKPRRDSGNQQILRHNGPMIATTNGFLKPKTNNNNNNSSMSSVRGKFPNPNPTAPIVSSSNKSTDYSKLSSTDRLELEKRQCQEREQELRKQRNSISASTSSTNTTINGDSGNVSQEEHDEDQERYSDKIERLKRTENEKAHAPLVRPTKKSDMSQKWEQMMANKTDE
ncbi:unnamed protein product [Rotaria sp. Silwood1]|nr:unnamed protein product [Rotaria sp. Silwood1]